MVKQVSVYVPVNIGDEEKICLECTAKKCNGYCERLRKEKQKLKEKSRAKKCVILTDE